MKIKKKHYPYLAAGIVVLLLAVYGIMPKAEPVVSITITNADVLNYNRTADAAVVGIRVEWDSEIYPSYLTVDILPANAPEVILPDDRDKYHLIVLPHKWVNTHEQFDKKGTFQNTYQIRLDGNQQFKAIVELKNDDLTSEEYLARDIKEFTIS
ncbi:MAG: hypothetical protein ABH829_00835 [archaeon]